MSIPTPTPEADPTPRQEPLQRPLGRRLQRVALGLASLLTLFLLFRVWGALSPRGGAANHRAAALPAPVVAVAARTGSLPLYLDGLGSVLPLNTVTVRSRVDGQLMAVTFREGEEVAKGSQLAQIDPRPFQVQLTQAEGQLMRDRELLTNARLDLTRYRTLWAQNSIPRQQLDTQQALVGEYEGAVKIDQGQIDGARLNLAYCRITAPIAGRVGLRAVDPGNMVHATDTAGLVTITQQRPITVLFSLPEDTLPKVMARLKGGARLAVEAWDRQRQQRLAIGSLLTVDNQIDPATGTVKCKALFANAGNELFPNQFVNARLLLDTLRNAVIVPSAAVQRGPQGTFVFLLKANRTVAIRPVTVGISQGGETAILSGVTAGDQVIVEGHERLRDGSAVAPKSPVVSR